MKRRRTFLKTMAGGVVAGFPAIVPSSVLGQGRGVAPSDRFVMGQIGVGRRGSGVMRSFLRQPDVRMAAICDVQQTVREEAAGAVNQHYGDNKCAAYNDFRELLERDDIDAVGIATGERWHPLLSIAAAEHGKHIYCEKPLALTIEESKAVRAAVRRNGVTYQAGTQRRSQQHFQHAIELIRNGRIGRLERIVIGSIWGNPARELWGEEKDPPPGFDYDMWLGPAPWAPYSDMRVSIQAWLFIKDYGFGCLDGAWGIHDIDLAQWMAGDRTTPVAVDVEAPGKCYQDIRDCPYEWHTEQRYGDGLRLIHMDMVAARKYAPEFDQMETKGSLIAFGSEGWLHATPEDFMTHPASVKDQKIGENEIHVIHSEDHARNLLDAIRSGEQPISPIENAVRDQIIAQQQYLALSLNRRLEWDPTREEFIGDAEANRRMWPRMRSPWRI